VSVVPANCEIFGLKHWQLVFLLTGILVIFLIFVLDRACRYMFSRNTKYIEDDEEYVEAPAARTVYQAPAQPVKTSAASPDELRRAGLTPSTRKYTPAPRVSPVRMAPPKAKTPPKTSAAPADDWADEVHGMDLAELRNELKARGLSCFGSKAALATQLIKAGPGGQMTTSVFNSTRTTTTTSSHKTGGASPAKTTVARRTTNTTKHLSPPPEEESEEEEEEEAGGDFTASVIQNMSLAQLRTELKDRGVSCFGSKDALGKKLLNLSPKRKGSTAAPSASKKAKKR